MDFLSKIGLWYIKIDHGNEFIAIIGASVDIKIQTMKMDLSPYIWGLHKDNKMGQLVDFHTLSKSDQAK